MSYTCPGCKGIVHSSRRVPLELAIVNHAKSCPSAPKPRPSQ